MFKNHKIRIISLCLVTFCSSSRHHIIIDILITVVRMIGETRSSMSPNGK